MDIDTSTLDDVAIDESIAGISTADAANFFIQTIISKFQERYAIEKPAEVRQAVRPVVRTLQALQKKGFDMEQYAKNVVIMAAAEFECYSGKKDQDAYQSTLIVISNVMHKHGTGYWKKEREF